MGQKIVPNLWYDGQAVEAADFYCSVLPRTTSHIEMTYPLEGLLDFQRPLAGKALLVALDVHGTRLSLINAGPEFRVNPSISFSLNFHSKFLTEQDSTVTEALNRVWAALADGGKILMDLAEYPFSPLYGWVEDRFGVSWQLFMVQEQEQEPAQFLVPSLLFAGAAQNRAAEATTYYRSLFDGSSSGEEVYYTEIVDPVVPTSLMYSDFDLAGQRFSAMDSGVRQDFTFNSGVSLEVHCQDQAEIDRLWLALSAYPAEEQCGWLRDRFGLSWQIVPANMGELMQKPDGFSKLMKMGKIVIADF